MPDSRLELVRRSLLVLVAGALIVALAITVTGGGSWTIASIRLSVHDPIRPLLLGGVGLAIYACLFFRRIPEDLTRLDRGLASVRPWVALTLAVLTVAVGLRWGTFAAGGDDSYGYVSQASEWLRGDLLLDQSALARGLPWGNVDWTLTPLGATRGPLPHTIAPKYPPGLPLLMAAAEAVTGPQGPYLVVPLLGGVAVGLTFLFGSVLFDEVVGLIAALLLALSPVFLYQLVSPMSDVPAAAAWTLALLFAVLRRPAASGLAAGLAIAIRPNLAPLVVALAWIVCPPESGPVRLTRDSTRRLLQLVAGTLPGVAGVAWFNLRVYGAPWRSGYGDLANLYALSNVWPNLAHYTGWLLETQTPLVLAAILPFAWRAFRSPGPMDRGHVRAGLGLFLALAIASYLVFLPFDTWWYLRYLLPVLPLILVLAAGAAWMSFRGAGPRLRLALMTLLVVTVAGYEGFTASDRGVFRLQQREQHYIVVGHDLARTTPPNAIFISMQESGSLRLYARRWTLRWDWLSPEDLDEALAALHARGLHPYLLLEDWEEPEFRKRFAGTSVFGRLDWPPSREWTNPTVRLYDPEAREGGLPRSPE